MRAPGLIVTALIATIAGCMSQGPRRHVYALETALDTPTTAEAAAGGPELQLERVLVPDYLDTTDLLLRAGAHEIRESSTGRFGERLSLGITHALRSDLAAQLPTDTVALAQPAEKSARQILVNVAAFDVWPSGRCVLVANWTILDRDRAAALTTGRGTFVAASRGGDISSDAAIVSLMADAVGQLAERVASAVRVLPP
jgi:uncharacterized protein